MDNEKISQLINDARHATRKRAHLNLHENFAEPVQRMLVAIEPDSYIRPHRHSMVDKWELLCMMRGSCELICFDDSGKVTERKTLSANEGISAVEIPANTWHTLLCNQPGSVFLEVKQGPYLPTPASDFAGWAPDEESNFTTIMAWLRKADVGEHFDES